MTDTTSKENYDPQSFNVPASDTKGHNDRMQFRCPPGMIHQVTTVMQSKKFPYRSQGELLRHALFLHLKWLETLAPIPSVMAQVEVTADILRDEKYAAEFQDTFNKLGDRMAKYLGEESAGMAIRLLLKVRNTFMDMPDGYWRDKYLRTLDEKFGSILKQAPKADLGDIGEEEEE